VMRRRDFEIVPLEEAIDTSAIDRKARKALQDGLYQYLEHDWNEFAKVFPNEDQHKIYDAYYEWKREKSNDLYVQNLCSHASAILTEIVRLHVVEKFGPGPLTLQQEEGSYVGLTHTKKLVPRKMSPYMLEVLVQTREHSDDPYKTYGGYFQGGVTRPIIVVNVNQSDVWEAAMGIIQIISMGEGEGHEVLTNIIAPVFVHEYTHMEQLLRGDPNTARDPGYITKGGGPRGGRRSPHDGTLGWLRYKSSIKEIEAFAAQAASELIGELGNRYRYRENDEIDDVEINHLLEAIALGYAGSKSLSSYTAIAWGSWSEEAERLGINPAEMQKTYKRFLKAVYRQIWNYRQRRVGTKGKWAGWAINLAPEHWKESAALGLQKCTAIVAQDIAKKIYAKDPYTDAESLRRYSEDIHKGAAFINQAFFDKGDDYNDTRDAAVESAFQNLVIRLFNKEKAREEGLRRAA
jgi:hypothetical protein